MVTIPSCCYI